MPICPLAPPLSSSLVLPPLLLLCRPATSGTEVVVVTEVDADAEDTVAVGSASPAIPMWKGWSNMWLSLADFFGPEPGSHTSCTASDCVISAKLCPRNVQVRSE